MRSVLFIGSFLSKHQGTTGISEVTALSLREMGYDIRMCSSIKNKFARMFHIAFLVLFGKYQVVHIDVFSGSSFKIVQVASYIAKKRGKRVFLNLRGGMLPTFFLANQNAFEKVLSRADKIISPSKYLQQEFNKLGVAVEHLPNSVDLALFSFHAHLKNNYSLLWVRAFSPIYCPEIVIEVFRRVKDQFPEASLTMIGPDKGKRTEIEELISKHQLTDSVHLVGPVPHDKLPDFYHSHSVFLNTTIYESFGNCVIEAAACGIPIVSNQVGELPFMWQNEESIMFVENNDINQYIQAILDIWRNEAHAQHLRLNARKVAESFDRNTILQSWIRIFG
jgi:glycosyltransferase involved in cell wall biosynthesis